MGEKAKTILTITSFLKQGVKNMFRLTIKVVVRNFFEKRSAPPVPVYTIWDAVVDNSRVSPLL